MPSATRPLAPVYFISHGGPPSAFDHSCEPYKAWVEVGKRIREDVESGKIGKVEGIVAVSAHWEAEDLSGKTIEINSDPSNPLVYDFYNFPRHYYSQHFISSYNPSTLTRLTDHLSASYKVDPHPRGLDHGLFIPFTASFNQPAQAVANPPLPSKEAIDATPRIIQVSLPGDSSEASADKLGRVLGELRKEGYAIVATGQAVHNLRDFRPTRGGAPAKTPYSAPFLAALLQASTSHLSTLSQSVKSLFHHSLYKSAHPTAEHLLPLAVAAGAAVGGRSEAEIAGLVEKEGKGEVIFEKDQGPLGWAMIRWD